jgi:hypothetical protein
LIPYKYHARVSTTITNTINLADEAGSFGMAKIRTEATKNGKECLKIKFLRVILFMLPLFKKMG